MVQGQPSSTSRGETGYGSAAAVSLKPDYNPVPCKNSFHDR